MKVLITGAEGQVAQALLRSAPKVAEVVALSRGDLDITDSDSLSMTLARTMPAVVINAAAYTAVDQAESEPGCALRVNGEAVGKLARHCADRRVRLVHVSTDYVFDGGKCTPYQVTDEPKPINVYGATKLEGERRITRQPDLEYVVVRTAWVYSESGRNFLTTMLRLLSERETVRVVADQIGTPTSAWSLARCLWRCALDGGPRAVLHYTDAGVASWYDFAQAIFEEATAFGLVSKYVDVVPVQTCEYPTAARRPQFSVLEKRATLDRLDLKPTHWRVELREMLKGMIK